MPCKMLQPEGLVIALVFITTIVLIDSQIPENLVIVDVRPVFLRGYDGVLKCQFNGAPRAVFWLKGPDLATGTNLVTWYPPPRGISGSGYESGRYNLTEDFSLVINDVDEDDAGRYICRISNFRGFILRNFTNATVQIPPQRPFPTIDTCSTGASEPCILTLETGADSTDLTCRTKGATSGLVSLVWTHGGVAVPHQAPQESRNADGVTWDVKATITATPRDGPYVCVARLSATTSIEANASIIVYATPVVTTPAETFMTTNATGFPPNSDANTRVVVIVFIVLGCILLIILIAVLIWICWKKRTRNYQLLKSGERKDEGLVSYLELWELVEICDIVVGNSVVSKLVGNPDRESEYDFVRSKADLYRELCEWKDRRPRDVRTLYEAMEEMGLHIEMKLMRDIRKRTDQISNDNLEHICWHVSRCRKTVKPILRVLYSHGEKMTKLTEDPQTPENPRCDVIRDDLQLLKGWKTKLMTTNPEEGENKDMTVEFRAGHQEVNTKDKTVKTSQTDQDEDDSNEQTPMHPAASEEVDLKAKTLPTNQVIQMCLALEEAGKKADECDRLVYQQLAKTFFAIEEKNKSELTDTVLKKFALGITRRHCQRLGKSLRLPERDVDVRNEEDLTVMFRTDNMLKEWVLDQRCSNYEIRCRLRRAAEQCNRHDIAGTYLSDIDCEHDLFISKDQSEVMSSIGPPPASLTLTNEKQGSKARTAESSKLGNDNPSQSMSQDGLKDKVETQPPDNVAESEVSYVTAISRDELDRIGRYAGERTLREFCNKYGIEDVPDEQSPEWKELTLEDKITKIIDTLKPKLDSEHEKVHKANEENTPRNVLRQVLHDKKSPYDCLLPGGKEKIIYNVELIELAFRLVMADVYPFAKALGLNDQLLTHYKLNFEPNNLGQGTVQIIRTDDRLEMVKALKRAEYSEEAKAIYFGFEISLGDVAEVEKRVDMAQLAQQLCVPDDIQVTSQDNETNGVERQKSVLVRWKGTVRSSTFNQRLSLADALFNMGEEQLALDVISGKYRNRVITNPQSELLAKTISEGQLSELSQVLGQKVKGDTNCQDIITAWASDEKFFKFFETKPMKLSNQLLATGFYDFAQEIMAGAWRGKEDKQAAQKETEDKPVTTSKESPHKDSTGKEQGAEQDKEDNESMEKDTKGNTHPQNTGKEGAGDVKKNEADSKTVAKDAETGKTVESYGGKTKEKVQDEYKRELTDEDLKKFALGITRRHCQRLGKSLRLHERDIDVRNEEDLTVMFRTDTMLKEWVLDQRCSNYEIRLRLRRAAEQCNRHDIADLFISKDQSEVMSFDATLQASLTFTNEKQSPKANAPESNKHENDDNSDLMDTEGTQLTDSGAGSEVSSVRAISREELKRIGRYAGTDTLIAFLMEYGVREVPEQQSPEGKELPLETKIINTLKRKLDSVYDEIDRRAFLDKLINTGDTPRNVLRQFLDKHDKTSPYACLLPREKEDNIFNVELVELAFRLVMADVYPFAKALGINDQLLTRYKMNFGPNNLGQGTVRIIRTDVRIEMVKTLKQAGYLEEAKAIYFGFEIGLGDVVEVANRVDMAQLAQQLCVPGDIQGTSQDTQSNGTERQRSVLLQWKDNVRSSTFNQRLALADALFTMGEEQLALDVISGKYRNRVINNLQSELLAKTIPEGQLSKLSQMLGQSDKGGQNCQDIITAWASDKKFYEIGPLQKKPIKFSNQLLDAGFYDFAHEIMAGAWRGKEEKTTQKEAEDKGDVSSKKLPHDDSIANGQGAQQDQEDTENMEKETKDNPLQKNTGKGGDAKGDKTDSKTDSKTSNDARTLKTLQNHGEKNTEEGKKPKESERSVKDEASKAPITDKADDGHYSNGEKSQESERSAKDGAPVKAPVKDNADDDHDSNGQKPEESERSVKDGASKAPITDKADDGHFSNGQMPEESEKSVEDGASEDPVTDLSGGQAEASFLARVQAFLK